MMSYNSSSNSNSNANSDLERSTDLLTSTSTSTSTSSSLPLPSSLSLFLSLTDPDPAAVRAMNRVFMQLNPSMREQFCSVLPDVKTELINVTKNMLDARNTDGAWRSILEIKFIDGLSKLCPAGTFSREMPGVFDVTGIGAEAEDKDKDKNEDVDIDIDIDIDEGEDEELATVSVTATDVIDDIGAGIRGIGAGLSRLPIALIAAGGLIAASILVFAIFGFGNAAGICHICQTKVDK